MNLQSTNPRRAEIVEKTMQQWGKGWFMLSEPHKDALIEANLFRKIAIFANASYVSDADLRQFIREIAED